MINGTLINYYYHCLRQLWLFGKNICFEWDSEEVKIGKMISETTYSREKHEIHFEDKENKIVIDFFDKKRKILHEIKKSSKMKDIHIWQVKYYLYVLKKNGIDNFVGEIDYPKERRVIKVNFTQEDELRIEEAKEGIKEVLSLSTPPKPINKPFCKSCSYYEFCYC